MVPACFRPDLGAAVSEVRHEYDVARTEYLMAVCAVLNSRLCGFALARLDLANLSLLDASSNASLLALLYPGTGKMSWGVTQIRDKGLAPLPHIQRCYMQTPQRVK